MTGGTLLAMTEEVYPVVTIKEAKYHYHIDEYTIRVKSFKYLTQQGIVESYNF